MQAQAYKWLMARRPTLARPRLGWEAVPFAFIALAALGLRLWELDGRTMHYDEAIHLHSSWNLATGIGYSHSPWMHGPFQIHLVAMFFKIFSDTDFTARLVYAIFGTGLVALPYFLRTYLGRTGAVVTSLLLALSPSLLYFSRFGRNDILMAFWAVALLVLMWRYLNEGKNRYLYIASAVLALAFATKETSYFLVGIFGAALFVMSLTDIVPWALGRIKFTEMRRGPPAFLILLVTLTLPQWSALVSKLQGAMGVVLATTIGGAGDVGLPSLDSPPINFPLANLPLAVDALLLAAIVVIPLGAVFFTRAGRRWAKWLVSGGVSAALIYAMVIFPEGSAPRDYLISMGFLLGTLMVSVAIGLMWQWRVWLLCAAIFYAIWTLFYTSVFGLFVQQHGFCPSEAGNFFGTLCSKLGGTFTGSWQGLGYWLAQQEVVRGNQPWYYHFVIGSVYEFLPLLFGAAAIVYYIRKADLFGLLLGFWAVATLILYTYAGEKMPWLLVNVALPFILLAGKFIGEIFERVNWKRVLPTALPTLLVLPPLVLLSGMYLLQRYLNPGGMDNWKDWGLLGAIIIMAVASAFLIKKARPRLGMTLSGLGVAVLLLGFSSFVAFRASYNYDDTPVEMLVYAQGSADVSKAASRLVNGVPEDWEAGRLAEVDYELWYPLNWYVRHPQREGSLAFQCYKDEGEDGYAPWCNTLEEPPSTTAILLIESHAKRDSDQLQEFQESGPYKNLLWFPETYRRPREARQQESIWKQIKKDFPFFKDTVSSRKSWRDAVDYFLFRKLEDEWWDSKFFSYISDETPNRPDGDQE